MLKVTKCDCCNQQDYTAVIKLRKLSFNLCEDCANYAQDQMHHQMLQQEANMQDSFAPRISELK